MRSRMRWLSTRLRCRNRQASRFGDRTGTGGAPTVDPIYRDPVLPNPSPFESLIGRDPDCSDVGIHEGAIYCHDLKFLG
jgi:hypothetical protein